MHAAYGKRICTRIKRISLVSRKTGETTLSRTCSTINIGRIVKRNNPLAVPAAAIAQPVLEVRQTGARANFNRTGVTAPTAFTLNRAKRQLRRRAWRILNRIPFRIQRIHRKYIRFFCARAVCIRIIRVRIESDPSRKIRHTASLSRQQSVSLTCIFFLQISDCRTIFRRGNLVRAHAFVMLHDDIHFELATRIHSILTLDTRHVVANALHFLDGHIGAAVVPYDNRSHLLRVKSRTRRQFVDTNQGRMVSLRHSGCTELGQRIVISALAAKINFQFLTIRVVHGNTDGRRPEIGKLIRFQSKYIITREATRTIRSKRSSIAVVKEHNVLPTDTYLANPELATKSLFGTQESQIRH